MYEEIPMNDIPLSDYLVYEQAVRNAEADCYESGLSTYQGLSEWSIYSSLTRHWSGLVLDVGCGTGRFSRRLDAAGLPVVGFDFSEESLRVARSRSDPSIRFCAADVRCVPIASATADHVLSAGVLEHLLDPADAQRFFCEISRVLKRSGTALVSTYAYTLWDQVLRRKKNPSYDRVRYVRYSHGELDNFIKSAELEVDEYREWLWFSRRPLHLLQRALPPRGLARLDGILAPLGWVCAAYTVISLRKRP